MLALHSIGSTHQEAQDPITQGGVESFISELDDMFGGSTSIEYCSQWTAFSHI